MGIRNRLFQVCFPRRVAAAAIRRRPVTTGLVLMYHEVLPDDVELPAWTIVRASEFEWQMRFLAQHFDVVSMDHGLSRMNGRSRGRRPFAIVSFDDGYRGNFNTVLPIMTSLGLPFVIYAATRGVFDGSLFWSDQVINLLSEPGDIYLTVDRPEGAAERFRFIRRAGDERRWREMQRLLTFLKKMAPEAREGAVGSILAYGKGRRPVLEMLSRDDLRRLAAVEGVTIGAHTHGHELLDQLTPAQMQASLVESNERLRQLTGQMPRHFAYPNGNFNEQVMSQVKNAGYHTAVTTRPGAWCHDIGLFEIPRIGIGRFETRSGFRARVSGWIQ